MMGTRESIYKNPNSLPDRQCEWPWSAYLGYVGVAPYGGTCTALPSPCTTYMAHESDGERSTSHHSRCGHEGHAGGHLNEPQLAPRSTMRMAVVGVLGVSGRSALRRKVHRTPVAVYHVDGP